MKKVVFLLTIILFVSGFIFSSPLGMEIELRGGGYMTLSPETAQNMFGKGFLIGGSIRKSLLPMLKVGLSVDMIGADENAVQYSDLSDEMKEQIAAESDIEFSLTPICGELMFEPPLLPLYLQAGLGIYRSKLTASVSGSEVYNESSSRFGGFIGAGTKLGFPMIPVSFRAGARYHILKVKDEALEDSINSVSVEAGVRLKF
ncbi:MAG TPA: hypothetical protein VKN74_01845 [Candidatus Mcinerneyibacterium sp.]|nr:hypothetical protein [Candidatus Mcinerneyibacterium sp.]